MAISNHAAASRASAVASASASKASSKRPRVSLPAVMLGEAVAAIVADCTDAWAEPKPPWRARKEAYLVALAHKPQASLLVSLADKTHNAEAILFDCRILGSNLWDRFNGGADGTRW